MGMVTREVAHWDLKSEKDLGWRGRGCRWDRRSSRQTQQPKARKSLAPAKEQKAASAPARGALPRRGGCRNNAREAQQVPTDQYRGPKANAQVTAMMHTEGGRGENASLGGKEETADGFSLGVWVLDGARLRVKPGQTQSTCRSSPGPVPPSPHAPPSAAPRPPAPHRPPRREEGGPPRLTDSVASLRLLPPRLGPPTSGHTGVTGQSWVRRQRCSLEGRRTHCPRETVAPAARAPAGFSATVPRGRRDRPLGTRELVGRAGHSGGSRQLPRVFGGPRGEAALGRGPPRRARDPPGWGLAPRLHSPPPRQELPDQARARRLHVSAEHPHRLLVHLQAHGTRKAAQRVGLRRGPRQLRTARTALLLRRHLAAAKRSLTAAEKEEPDGAGPRRPPAREGRGGGGASGRREPLGAWLLG